MVRYQGVYEQMLKLGELTVGTSMSEFETGIAMKKIEWSCFAPYPYKIDVLVNHCVLNGQYNSGGVYQFIAVISFCYSSYND